MTIIYCLLLALIVFAAMEWVAWAMHKYVMHGFLWSLHKSHHEETEGWFELNDLFAVFFSVLSISFFALGAVGVAPLTWISTGIGIGMLLYGIVYFLVHDVLVHRRVNLPILPRTGYAKRLYQAHRLHHALETKENCVSFGFVWAPSIDSLKTQLQANTESLRK